MTIIALLTELGMWLSLLTELAWRAFAFALDTFASLSPLQVALALITLAGTLFATARAMQADLNRSLANDPDARINPITFELRYTLPGIALRAALWTLSLPLRLLRALLNLFRSNPDASKTPQPPPPPLLVPTLGPSYLWAMLITAAIFLIALGLTPLLRWQLDLPAHFPLWSYLAFGHRPELAPFLPLDAYPWLATLLTGSLWLLLWWTCARVVRLAHYNELGVNLIDHARSPGTLTSWRTHFAASALHTLDDSFQTWARWLPLAAAPLLLFAFTALASEPYRVNPASFALALVALSAWTLHLSLRGVYRPASPPTEPESASPAPDAQPDWLDVLEHLQSAHGLSQPSLAQEPRPIPGLNLSTADASAGGLISPLLTELLPSPARLTAMQLDVLQHLSRNAFVHIDPPADTRTLSLSQRSGTDATQLRHPNQLIIAPEGAGKSTLGMLAALNASLTHTRSSLFVVRNAARAHLCATRLQKLVTPSTLRWNLRIRRIDTHLTEDLATGIIPDVLVCDIHELTTLILADADTFRPLLSNLGLIILDDVETFCGPVEVHTQLAMRRLDLRLRTLHQSDDLHDRLAPIFLMLAADTMDDLPTFARSLCGVDAVPRYFDLRQENRPAPTPGTPTTPQTTLAPNQHLIYDLNAFLTPSRPLTPFDLIEACEACAVPWHWRSAGDDRSHLGRAALPLRDEPLHHVDNPLNARVVFVEGHATCVYRQLENLRRAGALLPPHPADVATTIDPAPSNPVALITIIDPIERLALDHRFMSERLAPMHTHAQSAPPSLDPNLLSALPRPFLRPPAGSPTRSHLASELTQHWSEVSPLLDIFGNAIAPLLRTLAQRGELLLDPRHTIVPGSRDYQELLYVRALHSAMAPRQGASTEDATLPYPVTQIEVTSPRDVCLRERSTLIELGRIDAHSARHIYYPGRIFDSAHGRHIVVAYADDQAAQGAFSVGDVIVEPFLQHERSAPLRRMHIDLPHAPDLHITPERRFLGDSPIGITHGPVQCRLLHRATRRLAPDSSQIREVVYNADILNAPPTLRTHALGIFPTLEPSSSLSLAGARMLAAALRVVTPLVYRGADNAVAAALNITADAHESDLPHDHPLAPTDAIFFIDLHNDGNGASRSIERDGVSLLLRLAWTLLANLHTPAPLLHTYDDWDNPLSDEHASLALGDALAWLDAHIHSQNNRGDR